MKQKTILFALCFLCVSLFACGTKNENTSEQQIESSTITETESASTQPATTQPALTEAAQSESSEEIQPIDTTDSQLISTEDTFAENNESNTDALTEEQALAAIKNYCISINPKLKDMTDSDKYTIYWETTTNDADEIVVLYRTYTGAQIRYYIDPVSGDTYVTEMVPGIIDEEQRTEERLNARDYLS